LKNPLKCSAVLQDGAVVEVHVQQGQAEAAVGGPEKAENARGW